MNPASISSDLKIHDSLLAHLRDADETRAAADYGIVTAIGASLATWATVTNPSIGSLAAVVGAAAAGYGIGAIKGVISARNDRRAAESEFGRQTIERMLTTFANDQTAVRQGKSWVVFSRGQTHPAYMGDAEYQAFKKASTGISIDEITFSKDKVTVSCMRLGRMDAGLRNIPAVTSYDLGTGQIVAKQFFAHGAKCSAEDLYRRNERLNADPGYGAAKASVPSDEPDMEMAARSFG